MPTLSAFRHPRDMLHIGYVVSVLSKANHGNFEIKVYIACFIFCQTI